MKTLDEVITAFEKADVRWSNDPHNPLEYPDFCDALHYLRNYRENQHAYEENSRKAEEARERYLEAVKNCEIADTSQITCPKCHSEFLILDDPDGDHQQLLKCQALLQDFYRNDPLSWDELKQMEGKPVWYEHEFWKGWIILGKVEQGVNCEMIPDREERWYIVKDGSAKAYRKERGCE